MHRMRHPQRRCCPLKRVVSEYELESPSACGGPGGRGSLPTHGSHRPGLARISASGSSTDRFATHKWSPKLFDQVTCDMLIEPRSARHVSLDRVCRPTLRFPPLGPPGEFPSFNGTIKRYDFLSPIPPHFVSFAWRYLGCTRDYAPQRTSAPSRPGVGNPVSPSGNCRGNDRISQVPGEPLSVCTCSNPTPAGLLAPDHYGAAAWPLVIPRQRLPREGFRRSIAWLSNSLSTLRRTGYPATTQDSLPVAGQALLDGLSTRKVPMKGFKVVILTSHSPFPSFTWRKESDRGEKQKLANFPRLPQEERNCTVGLLTFGHVPRACTGMTV